MREFQIKLHIRLGDWKKSPRTFVQVCTGQGLSSVGAIPSHVLEPMLTYRQLYPWEHMMKPSNGNISALLALRAENSPVTDEFPSQRPVTRSFNVFVDLHLNKRLGKQSRGWWFETPSRSLWRHSNENSVKVEWKNTKIISREYIRICRLSFCSMCLPIAPGQNDRHFSSALPSIISANFRVMIQISLELVPRGRIDDKSALVQVMAWRRTGDRPLAEPVLTQFIVLGSWCVRGLHMHV